MTAQARPQGRDEIRQAVLGAARSLVAERGLDGFSVRDVAARADVNHALVHRHFGSKAEVIELVLAEEARQVAAAIADWGDPTGTERQADVSELLQVLAGYPTYWRALAHAVLAAPEAAVPGTDATTELFRSLWSGAGPERATAFALAGATSLGWLIFGGFMAEATGADTDALRSAAAAQVAALTQGREG